MIAYTAIGALLALAAVLPLAWKWQLGVARMAGLVVLLALLCGLCVGVVPPLAARGLALRSGLVWLLTLVAVFAVLAYCFYRDPDRASPHRDDVVLSPADGTVLYVREARQGLLPVATKHGHDYPLQELTKTPLVGRDAVVVGIGMSFLDVHVNRAPIAGRVVLQRHFSGRFGSLRRPEMVFENERATSVIACEDLQVAVVQIASRLVRQIVSFVGEGQDVALGQRIGMIRFGSQVDLVLPAASQMRLAVKPGERVVAGRSIIATLERVSERAAGRDRTSMTAS
jgi:phosphatidylserine decarboxylase